LGKKLKFPLDKYLIALGVAKILDPDHCKEIDPEFRENAQPKTEALLREAVKQFKWIKMLAGGSGSGKTEIVRPFLAKDQCLILDTTLSNQKIAQTYIEIAQNAGCHMTICPVYIPLPKAKKFNLARRRNVPDEVLEKRHREFKTTMQELARINPTIEFEVFAMAEEMIQKLDFGNRNNLLTFLSSVEI
jgi:hypothetical protein